MTLFCLEALEVPSGKFFSRVYISCCLEIHCGPLFLDCLLGMVQSRPAGEHLLLFIEPSLTSQSQGHQISQPRVLPPPPSCPHRSLRQYSPGNLLLPVTHSSISIKTTHRYSRQLHCPPRELRRSLLRHQDRGR